MLQDRDKIVNFLVKKFDLREGEVELYLELLKTQSATVLKLSQSTGMNRITVHGYVDNLVKKGLVTQSKRGSRRVLVPESPDKLNEILEDQRTELKQTESSLPAVIDLLKEIAPPARRMLVAESKFFEGKEGVASIYKDSARADKVYSFVNIDKFYEAFPDGSMGDLLFRAMNKNSKREVWDITIDTPFARENAKTHDRYYCKYLSQAEDWYGFDILIYNEKTAIIQLEPTDMFANLIMSKPVAASLRNIHRSVWELLPEE